MTARIPLPSRLALQSLSGLQNAILAGANVVSNANITAATVNGFINAFEDDMLAPLRLIWMRKTDYSITLDQYGTFNINSDLSSVCLEVVSVYSAGGGTSLVANTYWQYAVPFDRKDLDTFRKLQGNVNIEPIYTIDGAIVRVWPPVNYYGPLACSYYADWPRLGDISSNSMLQVYTFTFSGAPTNDGSIVFSTTGVTGTASVSIASGDTLDIISTKLLQLQLPYSIDAGGNPIYWSISAQSSGVILFTAPTFVATNAVITATQTAAVGLTFTQSITTPATLSTIQTNWFLDNYPYLYYYGAMKHLFLYLADLERAKWASDQSLSYVAQIQAQSDRADFSDVSDGFSYNQNCQW